MVRHDVGFGVAGRHRRSAPTEVGGAVDPGSARAAFQMTGWELIGQLPAA